MAGIILYEKMPFRTVTDQKRHILIIGIGYGYIRMIFVTEKTYDEQYGHELVIQ